MAATSSAYWVKFFKGAGFPQDVATKHAVVFSNNRIKPDMLPDLDKPSLKEMGITLMGDMIAILRYAKKVVEETTCERFLVDSEDFSPSTKNPSQTSSSSTIVKKSKVPSLNATKSKNAETASSKVSTTKSSALALAKEAAIKKKAASLTRIISSQPLTEKPKPKIVSAVKRKISETREKEPVGDYESDSREDWNSVTSGLSQEKRPKVMSVEEVGYKIVMPQGTTARSQEILKKAIEQQKRTVFDRLGDSLVTSTTNLVDSGTTTFNITGLGKGIETFKRSSSSVFKRLGDKDTKKVEVYKNGTEGVVPKTAGILKNKTPVESMLPSSSVAAKGIFKPLGTMRADQEANKKKTNLKKVVDVSKKITFKDDLPSNPKVMKKSNPSSKLVSERVSAVPAKARLGTIKKTIKQVTFNNVTTMAHIKKPGVFSRLGF